MIYSLINIARFMEVNLENLQLYSWLVTHLDPVAYIYLKTQQQFDLFTLALHIVFISSPCEIPHVCV